MSKRWTEFNEASGVYFVGCDDRIKIGWSSRIGGRLRELETGTPAPLLLHLILADVDRSWEKMLHARFKAQRTYGEWFRFEGEMLEYLRLRSVHGPAQEQSVKTSTHLSEVDNFPDF